MDVQSLRDNDSLEVHILPHRLDFSIYNTQRHTTWNHTRETHIYTFYIHMFLFFIIFWHRCLNSTKNSGPQARHLLNSRETTNIIFMLPLNPSWGITNQGRQQYEVKYSKVIWLFFSSFLVNLAVSSALIVSLGVCIALRHLLAMWFIRSSRYLL